MGQAHTTLRQIVLNSRQIVLNVSYYIDTALGFAILAFQVSNLALFRSQRPVIVNLPEFDIAVIIVLRKVETYDSLVSVS